ncbi:MAG: hypothetical protein GY756_05470 [bacterium]|nr:hypothetical protein [bacterium]
MEYKNLLKKFNSNAGISKAKLSTIGLPSEVPEEYLNFLEFCNGGEGFIGEEYLILYKAEEIQQKNLDYAVSDIIPGIC